MAQGCSRTLLLDIQCLKNTYIGLKDDLAFDFVRPCLVHPSLFVICHMFSFRGWEN